VFERFRQIAGPAHRRPATAASASPEPAPRLTRDYECSNAKMSATLGFTPRRSVVEAVTDMLARIDLQDRVTLTDPRYYNIRWLELMHEIEPRIEQFGAVL
jgi:hypothetical protein